MQDSALNKPATPAIPFDVDKLDRLMEEAGIDLLLATSKHNVQYLLAAERAIFFDYMDALGVSRYLPVVIYPKGAPDKAAFVGHWLESHQRAVSPLWVPARRLARPKGSGRLRRSTSRSGAETSSSRCSPCGRVSQMVGG